MKKITLEEAENLTKSQLEDVLAELAIKMEGVPYEELSPRIERATFYCLEKIGYLKTDHNHVVVRGIIFTNR